MSFSHHQHHRNHTPSSTPYHATAFTSAQPRLFRTLLLCFLSVSACLAAAQSLGQPPAPQPVNAVDRATLLALPPRAWAVEAAAKELITLHHPNSYLRYRMHIVDEKGDKVRDIIESKDGSVARLIYRDGHPLTPEQDAAERSRLNAMLASPSDFARHIRRDDEAKKIAHDIVQILPDAMLYSYAADQPPSGVNGNSLEVVLDFKPNPSFNPPTTTSQALTGLMGRLWIDAKTKNVVRMEANIFRPVNFGWGILAHLYPGGKITLDQADIGSQHWILTRFTQQVTVRALMVKSMKVESTVQTSNFQILPGPISYQQAVKQLLDTPLPTR